MTGPGAAPRPDAETGMGPRCASYASNQGQTNVSTISAGEVRMEIQRATVECHSCKTPIALSDRVCEICDAAPQLKVGGYNFREARQTLYDASKGVALSNSFVFLGHARTVDGARQDDQGENAQEGEILIAMKTVPLDGEKSSVEMARREIQVFQEMGSGMPNLLPLLFGAETDQELVIFTPYAPGGDLHKLTSKAGGVFWCVEEEDVGALMTQILSGLIALHKKRYVHGDMKPQNIFLTPVKGAYVAQIGDFGLTRRIPERATGVPSEGGTPGYMAPESVGHIAGQPRPLISYSIDMFALGIMAYELLAGMSPFCPPSNVKQKLEFDTLSWSLLAPEAQDFVTKLMEKKPDARLTSEEAFEHAFIKVAPTRPREQPRPSYAPQLDSKLQFHTQDEVYRICSAGGLKRQVTT